MTFEPYEGSAEFNPAFMEAMNRFIREGLTLPSFGRITPQREQLLPINMYETGEDLIIVAPMPGMRSEDIEVNVTERILTIRGLRRGPEEETKRYLRHEWHYGPYYRALELPIPVDAEKANASFSNGLLVVSLPKSARARSHHIVLRHVGQNQGEYAAHSAAEFMPAGHTHQKGEGAD